MIAVWDTGLLLRFEFVRAVNEAEDLFRCKVEKF